MRFGACTLGDWEEAVQPRVAGWTEGAFTYVEFLVASTILLFLTIGLVTSNWFGVRITEIVEERSQGEADARRIIGRMSGDILTARKVEVGPADWATVSQPTNGPFVGNGIRLTHTDGLITNQLIYFVDDDNVLKSALNAAAPVVMLASPLVNTQAFMKLNPTNLVSTLDATPADAVTTELTHGLIQVQLAIPKTNLDGTLRTNVLRFAVPYRTDLGGFQ